MPKPLPQLLHHLLPDTRLLVEPLKLVAFRRARVAANRADIDHAVAVLDERAALDGDVQVGNVVQDEAHQLLVLVLADILDEAVGGQRVAELVGGKAILGKAEVEEGGDVHRGGAELFLLLDEIGAADEADGTFLAEGGEEGEHFGGDGLGIGLGVSSLIFWMDKRKVVGGGELGEAITSSPIAGKGNRAALKQLQQSKDNVPVAQE